MPPKKTTKASAQPSSEPAEAPSRKRTRAKLANPPTSTSNNPPPIQSDAAYPDTERGGQAAREVYGTLELRRRIFAILDRETLAGLLRLEKAATASVAELLYHTVHVSQLMKMSRATPRRAVYCDAVRVLDRNPIPKPDDLYQKRARQAPQPIIFNPSSLLKDLAIYQKKYPQLHTILTDEPTSNADDAYVVHLSAGTITVDLETRHIIKIYPFPSPDTPSLPPPPAYPGIVIRHTIALKMTGGYQEESYDYYAEMTYPETLDKTLGEWQEWLFDNPELDRRITSINVDDTRIKPSPDEIIQFLIHRKVGQYEPIRKFYFGYTRSMSTDQFRDIIGLLGSGLRLLRLDYSILNDIEDWHEIISVIDAGAPRLRHLLLPGRSFFEHGPARIAPPMSILPDLRILSFDRYGHSDPLSFARFLAGIGHHDCVYHNSAFQVKAALTLNALVTKLKSPRQEFDSLRLTKAHDLDLWDTRQMGEFEFEYKDGQLRRIAWNKAEAYASKLSDSQSRLLELLERQKAAVEDQQAMLSRMIGGVAEAKGDLGVQSQALKRGFERMEKEQKELDSSCDKVKRVLTEMQGKSKEMLAYAKEWLRKQDQSGNSVGNFGNFGG